MRQIEELLLNLSIIKTHYSQCECLLKAQLKSQTDKNIVQSMIFWVRFGFQLDSLEKKSDPPTAENCVGVQLFLLMIYPPKGRLLQTLVGIQ